MTDFDNRHVWTPLAAMPDGAARWGNPLYRDLAERWAVIQSKLEDRERERAYLDGWLQERKRAFAIETGQIEHLRGHPRARLSGRGGGGMAASPVRAHASVPRRQRARVAPADGVSVPQGRTAASSDFGG